MTKSTQCDYDPRKLTELPIGMFHCPKCGDMILAGIPHPPRDGNDEALTREPDLELCDQFHALWISATEQPGYNKEQWVALQRMLNRRGFAV